MKCIQIILFCLLGLSTSQSISAQQTIYFLDQHKQLVLLPFNLSLTYINESDTIFEKHKIIESELHTLVPKNCKLVKLQIEQGLIKGFYNEYFPEQFRSLQEINVHMFFNSCTNQSPSFYYHHIINFNKDTLSERIDWFTEYAKIAKQKGIYLEMVIYNTYQLTKTEKKAIEKLHEAIIAYFQLDKQTFPVRYDQKPFTTLNQELFAPNTEITDLFIRSLNTPHMKQLAADYKLVAIIAIRPNE